jgi:hypothetical protein
VIEHVPQPPPTSAANVDSNIVKTIAALYASQSDKEAEALYQETSIGMSAREKLKLSHIIEEEIRHALRANKEVETCKESQTPQTIASHSRFRPFLKATGRIITKLLKVVVVSPLMRLLEAVVESFGNLLEFILNVLEGGLVFLYFAFWIALAIVVFYTACRIIGF